MILTHTSDEVGALNEAARERMRDTGELGDGACDGRTWRAQFAAGIGSCSCKTIAGLA